MVIVDSHRSVWLAGLVLMAYFLFMRRTSLATVLKYGFLLMTVFAAVLLPLIFTGYDVLGYVARRAEAYRSPINDPTSSWRILLWLRNLAQWAQHPLDGLGFGPYYQGNVAAGVASTTSPHDLYVQTLVTLGAVGLALLVGLVVCAGVLMWSSARGPAAETGGDLDTSLALFGLGVLLSSSAYWLAYGMEPYTLLWMGLGVAAALARQKLSREHAALWQRGTP
jgi:O-antigen ligase